MRVVSAVIRVSLGLFPDEALVSPKLVLELIEILAPEAKAVQPLLVSYMDIDTGLIVAETTYGEGHNTA